MSLSLRHSPRGYATEKPPPARSYRTRIAAFALCLALIAALVWTWTQTPVASPSTVGATAAGAMALTVLAYVVLRRRQSTPALETMTEPLQSCAAPTEAPASSATEEAPEPVDVRALHLHVRTLETALEEQIVSLARTQAQLMASSGDGADLQRVLVTVDALRERLKGNPESEHVLNRVQAAVTRLSSPATPGRPALPAPVAALPRVLAPAPAPAGPPAVTPAPAAPPEVTAATAPEEGSQEDAPAPPDESPAVAAPVSAERVLPVPAPPVIDSRPRRWRRRRAA